MDYFFPDQAEFERAIAKLCLLCGKTFKHIHIRQQHEEKCLQFMESAERVKEKYLAIKKQNEKLRPIIIPPKSLARKRVKRC